MTQNVDALDLAEPAHSAALSLQAKHPDVVFTSDRRGVDDQARAMSQNVARNRRWIAQTYVATSQSRALQIWVDAHPLSAMPAQIEAGLATIMSGWTDAERGALSKHFSGHAFDVQPVDGARGEAIKATIRGLPGLSKFLEREGGLIRWHLQF